MILESTVRPQVRTLVLAAASLMLSLTSARAAEDPFQLRVATGVQMERLHSVQADSLGLSATQSIVTHMSCDFRVFDLPFGKERPALHVLAETRLGRRAIPVGEFMADTYAGAPVIETSVIEVMTGARLEVPMTMLDPGAGSRLTLGYREIGRAHV